MRGQRGDVLAPNSQERESRRDPDRRGEVPEAVRDPVRHLTAPGTDGDAGRARQAGSVVALFAAAYFGFGALLFRQQHWARIALSVVALCHLVMVLGTGAVFSVQAVVLVIGVLAAVFLWQRASTDWLTGER